MDDTLEARGVVHADPGGDIARVAFVDRDRFAQGRAAAPALDDPRVAGIGERAGTEVRADDERVGVQPARAALGLGQREATVVRVEEALVDQIELAHHGRVRPTAGQRDQTAPPLAAGHGGRERVAAVPDPVLAFDRAQRVEVEHGVPLGFGLPVALQRGAAPQAAHVLGVLPEVVEVRADAADVGNALAAVQQRQQPGLEVGVFGAGAEFGLRAGVVGTHPVERSLALHVFEPEVRVQRFRHGVLSVLSA